MLPKIFDLSAIQHNVPFDPTYGFTLKDLYAGKGGAMMEGVAEPPDFDAFWEATLAEQVAMEPKILETRPSPQQEMAPGYSVEEIYFDAIDGWRVGAWLCRPIDESRLERVQVFGHGYGGREYIGVDQLEGGRVAGLFVCAPGFHLSENPKRVVSNSGAFHVINSIEDPRTYILRACVACYWQGARILQAMYPGLPMLYEGFSFGGGLGAMILAWGDLFKGGVVGEPTFANHPFRLAHETRGSASAVRALWLKSDAKKRAIIERTLSYYETVFHARRIHVPVVFCNSVFDPAVPAAGQFTVALSVPHKKVRIAPHTIGHYGEFTHGLEPFEERRNRTAKRWLMRQVYGGL